MNNDFLPPLFLPPSIVWAFASGLLTLVGAIAVARRAKSERIQTVARLLNQGAVWLMLATMVASLVIVGPTLAEFYLPIVFNSSWAALFAGLLGIILFAIRRNALAWYAALEIAGAAVTLIVCAASDYGSSSQRAAALLGGIYFLIRGLDNADKGELLQKLQKELQIRVPSSAALALLFFVTALFAPTFMERGRQVVAPPYLSSHTGVRLPVSELRCGEPFTVCDRAAWQERERLLGAGPSERVAAERRADERLDAVMRGRQKSGDR